MTSSQRQMRLLRWERKENTKTYQRCLLSVVNHEYTNLQDKERELIHLSQLLDRDKMIIQVTRLTFFYHHQDSNKCMFPASLAGHEIVSHQCHTKVFFWLCYESLSPNTNIQQTSSNAM